MVPFDLHGLAAAMGGNQPTVTRLDEFFRVLNDGMDSAHSFFGNEPGENTPWIYAFVGAPARTQAVVRRILRELYLDEPRGLPGNDDAGALSSWAVFASLGLYPSIPGVAGFVVGSPLFPEITVRLARNRVLRIVAPEARAAAPFVRSLRLDGHPYDRAWIPWSAVAGGAELAFGLSDRPDPSWAVTPDAAPP
jgi:putative alpha-1,2-mannosidase